MKYPKSIYVVKMNAGEEAEYLSAHDDPETAFDEADTAPAFVAVYRLEMVQKITRELNVKVVPLRSATEKP